MKLALETRSPMDALADVLVLGRYAAPTRPAAELVALDKKLDGLLSTVLGTEKFEGKLHRLRPPSSLSVKSRLQR